MAEIGQPSQATGGLISEANEALITLLSSQPDSRTNPEIQRILTSLRHPEGAQRPQAAGSTAARPSDNCGNDRYCGDGWSPPDYYEDEDQYAHPREGSAEERPSEGRDGSQNGARSPENGEHEDEPNQQWAEAAQEPASPSEPDSFRQTGSDFPPKETKRSRTRRGKGRSKRPKNTETISVGDLDPPADCLMQ